MAATRLAWWAALIVLLDWPSALTWAGTPHVPGASERIQAALNAAAPTADDIRVTPATYQEAINFLGQAVL